MPGRMPAIRILLDQNAPIGLRRALADHEVVPAGRMGWAAVTNGDLIRAADAAGFTVLITCEKPHAEFARDQVISYGADWRLERSKGSMSAIVEPAT